MHQPDLRLMTEDIEPEKVLEYLVRTPVDADLLGSLKSRSPVLLRGSRGSGKSLLLRSAQQEMLEQIAVVRVLPAYASFGKTSLVKVSGPEQFLPWMISSLANSIVRAAYGQGLTIPRTAALNAIGATTQPGGRPSRLERVQAILENAWRKPKDALVDIEVPDAGVLVEAAKDLCRDTGIRRIILLVDEAAQAFIPAQQRQFFTLMRDLRSPYLSVKAAVYPGATSFGYSFQPGHDAQVVSVDREVSDKGYIKSMREIVARQDEELAKDLSGRGELLDILALAATGNPRVFLTTLSDAMPLNQQNCERVLKKYYSQDIWHQHNNLAEQYPGHRPLIEWGSSFMHDYVFPALKRGHYRDENHGGLRDIWIHRDAPQPVQEAMQFLCYSGVLQEGSRAVKRHGAFGTRYVVNLGCQFTQAGNVVKYAGGVRNDLSGRDVIEFGRDHDSYDTLDFQPDVVSADGNAVLEARLRAPVSVLSLSRFQQSVIEGLKFKTVGDVLKAEESTFKKAKGVADVRARQIHNAAQQAVMEYLSG